MSAAFDGGISVMVNTLSDAKSFSGFEVLRGDFFFFFRVDRYISKLDPD